MDYKCTVCGGELHYDPALEKLKCDFCGSTFELEDFAQNHPHAHDHDHEQDHSHEQTAPAPGQYAKATDDSTDVKEDLVAFTCPHCAAEVITDKNTVATRCVFCGTPMVIEEQASGSFRPDQVIPFAVDKKQIEQIYEDYIQTKPFYPEEYSKANVIEKIRAVYLPFWLYDMKMAGELHATGERTASFTTGKWIVTNHDVFDLYRDGEMGFHKIPAIASSKTPKDAMDALEPFDYSKLEAYNPGYLPGFLAQRYDIDSDKNLVNAQKRAETTFNNAMISTLGGYEGLRIAGGQMSPAGVKADYTLMPAYLLFMDYDNDEDKLVAINGQTGKIVGNVPVDARKRNRFFFSRFILLWIALFALAMILMIVID